jgi:cytosine/uracil/thiamine/allantoin permease
VRAWKLILIGFLLCLSGVIFPFLMVVKILESSFLLNFLSYTASVLGLFLGIIGAAYYVRENRKQ